MKNLMLNFVKRILVLVLAAMIFNSPVLANESIWQPEIRLGILSGVNRVNLIFSKDCVMVDAATFQIMKKIPANKIFSVSSNEIKNSVEFRSENVFLKDLIVAINDKKYFGGVRIDKKNNSLTVIVVPKGCATGDKSVFFPPSTQIFQAQS